MFKSNLNRGQSQNQQSQKETKPDTGPLRLPQLWEAPTTQNVADLLEKAKKRPGSSVDLPYSVPGCNSLYQLGVVVKENQDPEWTFKTGTLTGLSVKWTLPSIDVLLIYNLISSETGGDSAVDTSASNAAYSRSSTGNFTIPETVQEQAISQNLSTAANTNTETVRLPVVSQRDSGRMESTQQAALEGDLEKLALPAVLQSLHLGKKGGRLSVAGANGSAEIFFADGNPVHAVTGEFTGDAAVIELLTWQAGKFKFFENELSEEVTVTKRLDSLIIESMGFLDQYNYLKAAGLTLESYLKQVYPNLSETQFEQLANRGTGYNLQMQKDFYIEIDGQTNLYDLLVLMPLSRQEWVPVIYNLLQVGLIQISNSAPAPAQPAQAAEPSYQIDEAGIQSALKLLQRPETAVFSYPVLQYFIKQELGRFERDGKAFSVIIFDMMTNRDNNLEFLPPGAVKALLHRINGVKRDMDVLAHFETFDFGLMLPQTGAKSAIVVAQRIIERIKEAPAPGLEGAAFTVCFGIASVPQDCKTAGGLLCCASEAKKYARRNNLLIAEYKSVENKPQ